MKRILASVLISIMLLISFSAIVNASGSTLKGEVQFRSSFSSSYMAKHGYVFIEESNKANIFAAGEAEIIVKNTNGMVVGKGKADRNGIFSISVTEGENYKVLVKYHGRKTEYEVSDLDVKNFTAYLGEFNSEEVGNWIDAKLKVR